jgi:anti-sigma B factor antagonist
MDIATTTLDGGSAVIRVPGRLNMVGAPRFRAAIADAVGDGRRKIVVDFSETTFMDSSGLAALVAGLKVAREVGGDLRIAGATDQVESVIRMTGLDRVLRPHATVEAALGAR